LVWQRGTNARDADLGVRLATAAVHDAPNNGPILHTLGVALYRAGRWEEARAALAKSDDLCGPTTYVDFFLSMANARLGNMTGARATYERGCELLRVWDAEAGQGSTSDPAQPAGMMQFRGPLGLLAQFQQEAAELLEIDSTTK